MRKILHLITILIVSTSLHADVGDKWPSEQELAKAPSWPTKYTGNPKSCQKPNEDHFYEFLNNAGYIDEEAYEVDSYVDLNMDGTCEIIAFQRMYCGNRECSFDAFQINGKEVKDLGQVALGEYLIPYNGWLQIRNKNYTGNFYSIHLIRFINGSFRFYRSDRFEYIEKNNDTVYKSTEYRK